MTARFHVISLRPWRRHWRILLGVFIVFISLPQMIHAHAPARGGTHSHIFWYGKTHQKVIALTFDDGPGPQTPAILKTLQLYHARATFFVVGKNVQAYPNILKQEVLAHMEIGNHTYAHINMAQHSVVENVRDLAKTNEIIRRAVGIRPTLMRPPYGAYNHGAISAIRQLHMHTVLWSWTEDSRDWADPGVPVIVNRVLSQIRPGDVVLFHDGGADRTQTVQALPIIMQDLTAMGYRFVTVSQLMKLSSPKAT